MLMGPPARSNSLRQEELRMPGGGEPPNVGMPASVFNTLHGYTYNSSSKGFNDGSGNVVFLFVESDGAGGAQWFYATNTQGGINPKGLVSSLVSNIILSGTHNSQTLVMTYNSTNYKIRLERDANGTPTATAVVV